MTNLSQTFQLPFISQLKGRESFLSFTGGGLPVNSTATSLDAQIDNNSDNQETAMRVLLVEDHLQLAESVAQALKSAGLTVDVLHDGVAADLALSSEEYAVAILDVGLPRMDGFEVLARLRARSKNLPVLMLTARSDVKDRVHGLNLGADDYLAKPFELSELEARVKALLRRSVLGGERQQRCGVLAYDLDTRRFTLGEELLALTSREQAVLEALIARPGRVMSKEQLAAQVFGLDEEASPDAIEIYVHRLRKKLDGHSVAIVTFRGLGYLLESRDD
ncbi:DNA-binding response regulator TctD [Pseudomonas syringae pv. daphniphylli]|uniref:DNA-binding response regulator TctD n=1 Tax=Pseudomonas syringae pv. daphniphylli TaxID=264455 RepID=A0A9X0KV38_PSESX|nr:DNA-binding response regulator TctD [Pseudomonas syringae pv. daphniphylli]